VLWQLTLVFSALSLLSFGGGNATVPQMYADAVTRYHWITGTEFARFFALGKLAPGPTMTMGTLIGYAVAGLPGAAVATAAILIPAGTVTFVLGRVWHLLRDWPWRERFGRAVGPVILGLIWAGGYAVAQDAIAGWGTVAIAVLALVVMLATKMNQAVLMLAAGVIGIVVFR
jgi:chromate transporter